MADRIKTAFLTMTVCVLLTACGIHDDAYSAADQKTTDIAVTTEHSDTTANSGSQTKSVTEIKAVSQQTETVPETSLNSGTASEPDSGTDHVIKNDSFTIRLNAQNMISIFENDIEAEPTADELSAAVQAALVQYRAAEAKDLDAYIKSFRFTELSEPIVSMLQDMYQHREGDELRVYLRQSGLSAKYELIDDMVSVTDELIEDRFKDEFESIEDSFRPENYDETRLFLRQALGCITANSQKVKDNIEYETFFDSESGVDPLSGITENTVYTFYVEHCSRDQQPEGSNLYMYCSLIIDTAEKEYVLDDVYIWIIGGQCGVCLDQRLQTGTISDEIKGKTAQQMFDMLRDTASEE